jgi:N-acetylneuraminic acid mutarotase
MKYSNLPALAIAMILIASCEKDAEVKPKNYPFVVTNAPIVSKEGAELSADIKDLGNSEIISYGFVWSDRINPTIKATSRLFYEKPEKGVYSLPLKGGLVSGQSYYVRSYIQTNEYEVYGNEVFFNSLGSLPPVIKNFTPNYGSVGTKVYIEGENFSLSKGGNIVKFGNTVAKVDLAYEKRLVVTVPMVKAPEKAQISIESAGMKVVSEDSFDLWFPWRRLNDFAGGYSDRITVSFALNDKGYFGLGNGISSFWEYDPLSDTFTRKADFPKTLYANPMSFTANDRGYVLYINDQYETWGGGVTVNEFWEYNPENNSWTRKADFPGSKRSYGVTFSINDKGYIVGGEYWKDSWNFYLKDCWEYDPIGNTWTQKGDISGGDRARAFAFSYGGSGYIGTGATVWSSGGMYKFEPISDTWTYIMQYPGSGSTNIKGIVIGDKCYLGMGGTNGSEVYSDFWELNMADYSWKKMNSCPIAMSANLSFTIGNKGYIGVGWDYYRDYSKVLFEFDPSGN